MENVTFYPRAVYVSPTTEQLYRELESTPLPDLDDMEWPIPDMHTSEVYWSKWAQILVLQ
jgi:hypothetical protein